MKRKYRYQYGAGTVRNFPVMTIQPPLFRTVEDAYMHFVRHPEERQLVEDDGEELTYSALDDVFDRMEFANTRIGEQIRTHEPEDPPQSVVEPEEAQQEGELEVSDPAPLNDARSEPPQTIS